MAPNRITPAAVLRRAALLAAAALAAAVLLAACDGDGDVVTAVPDKEGDARILNGILGRQTAAIAAYDRSLRGLGGPDLELARQFRAQEQEHVNAIVKVMRGIGVAAEPAPEEIEVKGLKREVDYLEFLYEVESATIDAELKAISQLSTSWARPLLASIAANQAQHLALLRRALGAKAGEIVPEAFEAGTTPAP
jgi:Ferritin-like domain